MVGFAPSWLAASVPLCMSGVDVRSFNGCSWILFMNFATGARSDLEDIQYHNACTSESSPPPYRNRIYSPDL